MNDSERYLEYLQKQILTEGWEQTFDAERIKQNFLATLKGGWARQSDATDPLIQQLEQEICEHQPATSYDAVTPSLIFGPLLKHVQKAAAALGIREIRKIRLTASTDSGASPLARPTTGDHTLFIGLGTSAYCNYWAKAYTGAVDALFAVEQSLRPRSLDDLLHAGAGGAEAMRLTMRLVLYYGMFGTLLHFGEVKSSALNQVHRLKLLEAMELFVVAHEYAHFVAHENFPGAGELASDSQHLEKFCDELGLVLAREAASKMENFLAYSGVGATLLFRSLQLSDAAAMLFRVSAPGIPPATKSEESHPDLEERINLVRAKVSATTPEDQLKDTIETLDFYDALARAMNALGRGMLPKLNRQ